MTFEPVPEPSPWGRAAKVIAICGIVALAAVAVVGGASYLGRTVGSSLGSDEQAGGQGTVVPGQEVTVEIPAGSSAEDIGAILAAQGVVRSALEFEVAVRNNEAASRLQAGTYPMETLMDPAEVVALLVVGPVADVYRVTVVEGLRVGEILTRLSESSGIPYAEFEEALLSGEVSTSLREMPAERRACRLGRSPLPRHIRVCQLRRAGVDPATSLLDHGAKGGQHRLVGGRGGGPDALRGADHRVADRVRGTPGRGEAAGVECHPQPARPADEPRDRCHGSLWDGNERRR